jgi:phosphopantetheinyl transferase
VGDHRVILYYSALAGAAAGPALAALAGELPYARRLALERGDRGATLAGIALALRGLSEIAGRPVAAAELQFPQDGRPDWNGGARFSVSHTRDWVACAVASAGAIGLDVEAQWCGRPTLASVCDAEELAAIGQGGGAAMWVAKEATLKALGLGVAAAATVRVRGSSASRDGRAFHLRWLQEFPGSQACIATEESRYAYSSQWIDRRDLLAH